MAEAATHKQEADRLTFEGVVARIKEAGGILRISSRETFRRMRDILKRRGGRYDEQSKQVVYDDAAGGKCLIVQLKSDPDA